MSQLEDRIERDLGEIAAGAHLSPSAWESIVARLDDDAEADVVRVAPHAGRSKRPVWIAVAAAALVVIAGSIVFVTRAGNDDSITTADPDATSPSVAPPPTAIEVVPTIPPTTAPFVGVWVSTDTDGSFQTMEIVGSGADAYEVVVHDAAATGACAGAASTLTGTGALETDARLVVARPELTCDDGTTPAIGSPPQAELANFTFELDTATDGLVDSFGVVWEREGSNDESIAPTQATVPTLAPGTSGGMWPQSTLDDVRAAQALADADDPASAWQVDAKLAASEEPWEAEILARFMREELGWEEFAVGSRGYAYAAGMYDEIVFVRCAPGQMNPLSVQYTEAPSDIRGCAPTIDENTYETVGLSVTQPERRGASGIWVVERWEMLQPADSGSLFGLLYPDFSFRQVEQVAPPPDAAVTALLQAFLGARVDGKGAEQYLLREPEGSPFEDREAPVLYATTGGASYERFEMELLQGPVWPTGWREYRVRLFAEDETVVEQYFHVVRQDGPLGLLGLVYGHASSDRPTTENGQPVAEVHNEFAGTLSFTAPPLVPRGDGRIEIGLSGSDGRVIIGEDPGPDSPVRDGCSSGTDPAPAADTTALAQRIEADPDFETTGTVPVSIAGIDGLRMDLTFNDQDLCYSLWSPSRRDSGTGPEVAPAGDPVWRMRLYLVDYPESSWPAGTEWRPQVLTIAVIAPEADFERALEEATPIVESLEFHPG